MAILVLADHSGATVSQPTRSAIAAAQKIGGDVHVLVLDGEAAPSHAELPGVAKVLTATGEGFAHGLAEPVAALLVSLAPAYSHLLAPGSAAGKNVMPRVAALLDVQIISDIAGVVDGDTFQRFIYAGNALATIRSADATKVATVRAASFDPVPATGGSASTEAAPGITDPALSQFLHAEIVKSERPELAAARVVVSGGRAMGSADSFKILEGVADRLGAAIGASRAAVDAGYAPNDMQVGQTGKIVAPELYMAFGISGAIQHLAGMKDSKVIVAINKDEEAPIFQVADYGLVGDVFKIIPELEAELDKK
ncbi:electron transfer flavoprotein subunit alpha/FixB family protein [Plastoroseomonas arctica]|uniref:Electron transfer flavoprotein subunit alpha n=1 Tax=Plastoroseomonas arctica TaxID=1509237 RepID=A0AAF1JX73_9PROT|nr:FAD-binding protein [Plastoroseomonas arctica]MBR0655427.1 electron transfer flavoprotein subunit alpha/FixB family protein [Plastoroseomonas arctica]